MTRGMIVAVALLLVALPVVAATQSPLVLRGAVTENPTAATGHVQPDSCVVLVASDQRYGDGSIPLPRNFPWSYYDQGHESIAAMYPQGRILAGRRSGDFGKIAYSLVVYQKAPADTVHLGVLAGNHEARKAWHLSARCTLANWPAGLIAILESTAALQLPPR